MKTKALLIGCGKMGAQYDLEQAGKVWSHAKAYSMIDDLELTVTDLDIQRANKVAAAYNAKVLERPDQQIYRDFDLISITTPTPTHLDYLTEILNHSASVIVCEKPVVSSLNGANELIDIYNGSSSKVIVNYMRRFQPGYEIVKERLERISSKSSFKEIVIKYKRGFLNNATHAIDLLEWLFERPFDFKNFRVQKAEFDAFGYDPTVSGGCVYLDQPVNFVGICGINYPLFEVEIFFPDSKLLICHSGNEVRYYTGAGKDLKENINERQTNLLDSYMLPVIMGALDLFHKRKGDDNFVSALNMNIRALEIIESIIDDNASISN